MRITLKIDPERITVDDLIAIEEGKLRTRGARDLLARFVTAEDGSFLSEEEGRVAIGKMTLKELLRVGGELEAEVRSLMNSAVPPNSATS